eukprot:15154422-Alexandrium_andersonii.AAC.1
MRRALKKRTSSAESGRARRRTMCPRTPVKDGTAASLSTCARAHMWKSSLGCHRVKRARVLPPGRGATPGPSGEAEE